jgi:hypothetical protein
METLLILKVVKFMLYFKLGCNQKRFVDVLLKTYVDS